MKVIYLLGTFPAISETFILNEIVAVQKKSLEVEVYAFSKSRDKIMHPKVKDIKKILYLKEPVFLKKCYAHLYWIFNSPTRYLKTLFLSLNRRNGISRLFLDNLAHVILIKKRMPDHIHAHFGWKASNMTMLVNLLTGIKFTFTTHGSDVFANPPKNYRLKSKLAEKHIVISRYNKQYMINKFGVDEAKLEIIHCGIDFNRELPIRKESIGNRIISIARLEKVKGLDYLISACYLLKKQRIDFECLIVGEGSERVNLENQIRNYGLANEIKLLGSKTQEDVFELLAASTIKVLASRSEGIGVALMEAMACRVPVIAPKIRGVPELIEDGKNGFLVEPGNIEMLSEKIKILLVDKNLRKQFAENGHRKIKKDFNLEIEVDKLITIFYHSVNY